ncbi:FAD-binding oxidoreductase [Actinomycetospora cinnamomea]|uniref:Ferredoxin-NADP reductase n=1 Tax=Actinomycetospora cinnamomea TaxID=663609 RepID=A0A2U1FIA8_9PSEU|nr:FAD-binding oxidoreductase [Actinomycetospora cinnamomea]PVZ11891.1 ferredoxin-NADP reductase [Actinomycetospora cinnamomea]
MAGTAVRRRLTWRLATVAAVTAEARTARRLSLRIDGWEGHLPGQHVDVRLTAPDGYQAQRSYSIASAPGSTTVDLVVQRIDDGEVSSYLTEELRAGDELELRGPIGGYFVWHADLDAPLQLVAGGSGVAPFLAMLDHHAATGSGVPVRLLYSARSLDDVLGRERLEQHAGRGVGVTIALTRTQPPGWAGLGGRVTPETLRDHVWPPDAEPRIFVCGPTTFVEAVADGLVAAGHHATAIRIERFG